jgi:hypothetical protein
LAAVEAGRAGGIVLAMETVTKATDLPPSLSEVLIGLIGLAMIVATVILVVYLIHRGRPGSLGDPQPPIDDTD